MNAINSTIPESNLLMAALERGFTELTRLVLPAYDGGIWNYLFEPVTNETMANDTHLLRLTSRKGTNQWSKIIETILIQPQNALEVFAWVTSNGNDTNQAVARVLTQPRQLVFVWIILALIVLISIALSVVTVVIPCCCWDEICACSRRRRRSSVWDRSHHSNINTTHAATTPTLNGKNDRPRGKKLGGPPTRPASYLDENRIRTLSIGSVRAMLHDPRAERQTAANVAATGRSHASSTASSDLYVNGQTVVGRLAHTPDLHALQGQLHSNEFHRNRSDSVDTLPLGSEARVCPMPKQDSSPTRNVSQHTSMDLSDPGQNELDEKRVHYNLLVLNWIFIVLLILCHILVGYTTAHVYQYTRSSGGTSDSATSLQRTVSSVVQGIVAFLMEVLSQGERQTASTLEVLQGQVTNQLNNSAQRVISQLLDAYQITKLFKSVEEIKPKLTGLLATTAYVRDNYDNVIGQLTKFSGELGAYADLLARAFRDLCAQLATSALSSSCLSYKRSAEQLRLIANLNKVNANPSIALGVLMKQFNFNLSDITSSFDAAHAGIDRMTQEVIQKIQSRFRLESFLGDFLSIWKQLNTSVINPVVKQVETVQPSVDSYTALASTLISAGAYATFAIFLLVLTAQVTCLVFCLDDIIGRKMYSVSGTVNANSYTRPTLISTKMITQHGKIRTWPAEVRVYVAHLLDRTHIRLRPISVLCGVLSLLTCLILVVSCLLIPGMMLVQSEVCRNFDGRSNQSLTDNVLYRFMRHNWFTWLNNATVSGDIQSFLNIGPPTNLTKVISITCNPSSTPSVPGAGGAKLGLIGLVGHERSVNFQPLLTSGRVKTIIINAENDFVKQIVQTNFASYIPNNINDLNRLVINLSNYLDSVSYNESYAVLSGSMLPVPSLPAFVSNTAGFLNTLTDSVHVQTVRNMLQLINQSVSTLDKILVQANKLAEAFRNLTENQNLTKYFKAIFDNVKSMSDVVLNKTRLEAPIRPAFNASIDQFLKEMNKLLIVRVNQYLNVLIPCGQLYQMYHLIFNVTCESSGLTNGLGLLALMLVITTFLLIIDLFLFVRFNSRHQVQSRRVEHHLNWSKAVQWTYDEWRKEIHLN
ncbi:hypothetical protein FGIG_05143 [Fasciola gigantica]|uniref:Prominin protein n=1 Tax=Fasciola gigantica TaxID=46835 RepID=A0A504ZDA6_FASGI|nr:hypothetical protein FGIG_05143 [Fasciola gigantica]